MNIENLLNQKGYKIQEYNIQKNKKDKVFKKRTIFNTIRTFPKETKFKIKSIDIDYQYPQTVL